MVEIICVETLLYLPSRNRVLEIRVLCGTTATSADGDCRTEGQKVSHEKQKSEVIYELRQQKKTGVRERQQFRGAADVLQGY